MKNNHRLNLLFLLLSIVVLIGIIYAIIHFTMGKEGAITRVTTDEKEFNNTEVLETLNLAIRKAYIDTYKEASENKVAVDQIYNSDKVLSSFVDLGYIEKYKTDEEGVEMYYIIVDNLKVDITNGKGENGSNKDLFVIEKNNVDGSHMIEYFNSNGEKELIGSLNFTPEV